MNDSGFWIFAKMGGLTETQTLRSWTPVLAIVGGVAFVVTLMLAWLLPMAR
jgi:H+/gluconate symporter-like permease